MSDDSNSECTTLQQRRLRLRNARVSPSQLPPSGYYNHNTLKPRILSPGGGIAGFVAKNRCFPEDGWETEDPDSPLPPPNQGDEESLDSDSAKKRRNRVSSSSVLSSASTLIGMPDSIGGKRSGELTPRSPNPISFPTKRAPTSPLPTRPASMIESPSLLHQFVAHKRNRYGGSVAGGDSASSSARYIDYLERQVADTVSQLQSYTSPSEGTSHAMKMRKLAAEARLLKSEVADWEAKFSARVKEEVASRQAIDQGLRLKVKGLEMKLEESEYRYKLLELDLEDANNKVADLRGLQEENRSLEFRIQALSDLLVDSTRLVQTVSSTGSATGSSRPNSVICLSRTSPMSSKNTTPDSRRTSKEGNSNGMEDYGITDPIEAVLSAISRLTATEEECEDTDPTSIAIVPSASPPALMSTPSGPSTPCLRSRRMRRFPSGSLGPKTLILPSATVVTSPTRPPACSSVGSMMCTRPCSSSSAITTNSHMALRVRSSAGGIGQSSLFAELARAEIDPISAHSSDNGNDVESTSGDGIRDPMSPIVTETFTVMADALSNPAPLVVKAISKVGESFVSPEGTFLSAKRRAMDMLGGVVGKGVDRVSRRRAMVMQTRSREARRRKDDVIEDRLQLSKRCGCCEQRGRSTTTCLNAEITPGSDSANPTPQLLPTSPSSNSKALTLDQRKRASSAPIAFKQPVEDAVDQVWLWVRFVVALVVALGVAVREGPGVVLAVDGVSYDHIAEEERSRAIKTLKKSSENGRSRREWKNIGEERLKLWDRPRS